MDRLETATEILVEARALAPESSQENLDIFRRRVAVRLESFQNSLELSTKAAVGLEPAEERLAEVLTCLPGYGLTVDSGSGKVIPVGHPVSRPRDPWDRGATFVCGTCHHFLEKGSGQGRCKARPPTMRGYPVVFAHEAGCGGHKLATPKA